ncbi:hypothetical protein Bca4012_034140 [Brassica carinata]
MKESKSLSYDISWLDDDALTASDKQLQYYESAYLPVKMKKVVVRTREDVESTTKLRSKNATFYMSFTSCGGLECRGIIRRTTDEIPQHMSLQVKCWIDN